jgi:hypothetical protein
MKLTVADRLIILNILQGENDVTTLRTMMKVRELLGFTEEEHAILQFKSTPEQGTKWEDGVPEKEFELGQKARDTILKAFLLLNEKKLMTFELLPTFEKFEDKD